MKRELTLVIGGTAIVAAGIAGCGSEKQTTTATKTPTRQPGQSGLSTPVSGQAGLSQARVVFDGQDLGVTDGRCTPSDNGISAIVWLAGGASHQVQVTVDFDANPPDVQELMIKPDDREPFGWATVEVPHPGEATAVRNGDSYTVTGRVAQAYDPEDSLLKSLEITFTCK